MQQVHKELRTKARTKLHVNTDSKFQASIVPKRREGAATKVFKSLQGEDKARNDASSHWDKAPRVEFVVNEPEESLSKAKLLSGVNESLRLMEGIDNLEIRDKHPVSTKKIGLSQYRERSTQVNSTEECAKEEAKSKVEQSRSAETNEEQASSTSEPLKLPSTPEIMSSVDDSVESRSRSPSVVEELEILTNNPAAGNNSRTEAGYDGNDNVDSIVLVKDDEKQRLDDQVDKQVVESPPTEPSTPQQEHEDDVIEEEVMILTPTRKTSRSTKVSTSSSSVKNHSSVKDRNVSTVDPEDSRPASPEVLQITKTIPEDNDVKITLTKSSVKQSSSPRKDSNKSESTQRDDDNPSSSSSSVSEPIIIDDDVKHVSETSTSDDDLWEMRSDLEARRNVRRNKSQDINSIVDDDSENDKYSDDARDESSRRSRRPKRQSLSQIDKAKLKNLAHSEREKSVRKENKKNVNIDCDIDEGSLETIVLT